VRRRRRRRRRMGKEEGGIRNKEWLWCSDRGTSI